MKAQINKITEKKASKYFSKEEDLTDMDIVMEKDPLFNNF